jgi:hypothetical protein
MGLDEDATHIKVSTEPAMIMMGVVGFRVFCHAMDARADVKPFSLDRH